jgi:hypothetical protein
MLAVLPLGLRGHISDKSGLIDSISHKFCKITHHKDGYGYV